MDISDFSSSTLTVTQLCAYYSLSICERRQNKVFVMHNSMYVAGGQTQDMFMLVQVIIISQKDLFLSARVIKRRKSESDSITFCLSIHCDCEENQLLRSTCHNETEETGG